MKETVNSNPFSKILLIVTLLIAFFMLVNSDLENQKIIKLQDEKIQGLIDQNNVLKTMSRKKKNFSMSLVFTLLTMKYSMLL